MVKTKESTIIFILKQMMKNHIIRFVRIVDKDWPVEKNNLRVNTKISPQTFPVINNNSLCLYINILSKRMILKMEEK